MERRMKKMQERAEKFAEKQQKVLERVQDISQPAEEKDEEEQDLSNLSRKERKELRKKQKQNEKAQKKALKIKRKRDRQIFRMLSIDIEVTKSPRGNLRAGDEITGFITVENPSTLDIDIPKVHAVIVEYWKEKGLPMTRKQAEHEIKWGSFSNRIEKKLDEDESAYQARKERAIQELMNRPPPDVQKQKFHTTAIAYEANPGEEAIVILPEKSRRFEYTIKMPSTWTPREMEWRMELHASVTIGLAGARGGKGLIIPVEHSKMQPSWYFEPLPTGPGAGGSGAAMFERPSSVGTFQVIPKGQKTTLQISRGETDNEISIAYQTPGVVRKSTEFVQKVDPEILNRLMARLDTVSQAVNTLRNISADDPARAKVEKAHQALKKFGHALYLQVIPSVVQEALKNMNTPLEFGLHEKFVGYPWELMHDGDDFTCLRLPVGRFVASEARDHAMTFLERGKRNGVKFLLIVDPDGSLPGAREEGEVIRKALEEIEGVDVKVISGQEAESIELITEFAEGYDFIHYSGHAVFDADYPENSGILLADGLMKAYSIASALKSNPPILAFFNACESGRQADWSSGNIEYENQVSGLASAFLVNGINFIGPMWPVYDDTALMFSKNFYYAVLSGTPLGEAVMGAKKLVFDTFNGEEIAWASYSLYGDPTQTLEFEK